VSKVIAHLQTRGVVTVQPSRLDGRRNMIRLTRPARAAIATRSRRGVDDAVARMLGGTANSAPFIAAIEQLHNDLAAASVSPGGHEKPGDSRTSPGATGEAEQPSRR
jgi:DNA-binding MarR family transcriptional regulator